MTGGQSNADNQVSVKHKISAFKYNGFWQSMDTLRDKKYLEDLWIRNVAPWKTW